MTSLVLTTVYYCFLDTYSNILSRNNEGAGVNLGLIWIYFQKVDGFIFAHNVIGYTCIIT